MSTWNIYHKDGTKLTDVNGEQITVHGLEYSDSWMGECFLTINFKHEVPINFQIGDYIVYRGERFELNYEPGKDKQARPDTYGEGFVYDSVKFNALQDELARAEFLDVVLNDNELHYTDMVRDVTKNIVSQKIMEKALEKPLEWLTGILDEKGKLDETDMDDFADKLYQVGENVVPQLTGIFDALKNKGLDLRENGSSSTTNSIKGITEETADLLASYLNAVRLDVSVIREMQGKFLPEMSEIAKSQLAQLNLIAQNTLRNADAAERIDKTVSELNDNFNRVINGTKSLKMK